MSEQDVAAIWSAVTEEVKTRIVLPSLWRAMEAARGITVDDSQFVVGLPPHVAHDAGLILEARNLNVIQRTLEEVSGQPWRLKVIEGETLEDWVQQKRREEEAAAFARSAQDRRRREAGVEQGWEGVAERLTRRYAELPLRGLPVTQAAYLEEALEVLADAVKRLFPPNPSELDQRALSRTIDKVSDRAGVPSALIAFLLRQRTSR